MIKNNFYPTATTGDIDTTAGITSITDERIKTDFFDPYFMGYLTPENAPIHIRPNKYTLGDGIDISPVDANIAWGYLVGSNERYYERTIYRTDGNAITQYSTGAGDRHLINAVKMARVCLAANIEINVSVLFIMDDYYVEGVGLDQLVQSGRHAGGVQGLTLNFSINDFLSMYKNGGTFINTTVRDTSTSSPVYNIDFPLNIDFNDMPKDGTRTLHIPFPEHDCVLLVQINGYNISDNTVISVDGAASYANIKPFSAYSFDNNKIAIIPGRLERNDIRFTFNKSTLQTSNLRSQSDSYYPYTPIDDIDGYLMGAFDIHLPSDIFAPADNYHNVIFGNTFTCGGVGGMDGTIVTFRMDSVLGIDDIYKYLLLFHKNTTVPSDTYSADDIVTVFDSSDTPTLDTISGSPSEIITRLRPWQIPGVDISSNTFTPEDIPTPEPEDADSSGDDIRDADFTNLVMSGANNFITMYAMSPSILEDFGKKMWAALGDQNFWESIATVFENDMSINPADILRYIISLRFFPFDLSTIPHDSFTGIYFGRATRPILPSFGTTYPMKINRSLWQIRGGSVTIPKKYNDFRDYEPCTTVQVHVPFCGSVALAASEVMGKTLYIDYKIDLQTGAMLAVIGVASNTYYVIATLAGSCGATIPITANNNIEYLQRVATVAEAAISGGRSSGNDAMSLMNNYSTSPLFDAPGMAIGGAVASVTGAYAHAVGALAGLPPVTVHKQGNATAFANLGGVNNAYVTIQRERFILPDNYGHTSGYACDFSETVGNLSGYAVCSDVDTSSISGFTVEEVAEIKRLLESGVYV